MINYPKFEPGQLVKVVTSKALYSGRYAIIVREYRPHVPEQGLEGTYTVIVSTQVYEDIFASAFESV